MRCTKRTMPRKRRLNTKLEVQSDMKARDVVEVVQLFERNGIQVWLDGGWGVDALLEEQTR